MPNCSRRWVLGAGALLASALAILVLSAEFASKTLSDAYKPGVSAVHLARIDAYLTAIDVAVRRADKQFPPSAQFLSSRIAGIDAAWREFRSAGRPSSDKARFEMLWVQLRDDLRQFDGERSVVSEGDSLDSARRLLRDEWIVTIAALEELQKSARGNASENFQNAAAELDRWRWVLAALTVVSLASGGWTAYRIAVQFHRISSR